MKRKKSYILYGDPVPYAKARFDDKTIWDESKQLKCTWLIELENQHNDEPLMAGMLILDVSFYFETPFAWRNNPKFKNYPCVTSPSMVKLLRLIEYISRGILYDNSSSIVSISSQKLYDTHPRIEFSLTQVDK